MPRQPALPRERLDQTVAAPRQLSPEDTDDERYAVNSLTAHGSLIDRRRALARQLVQFCDIGGSDATQCKTRADHFPHPAQHPMRHCDEVALPQSWRVRFAFAGLRLVHAANIAMRPSQSQVHLRTPGTMMLNEATKTKLRDPDYFALHLKAAQAIREAACFQWYDSNFLRRFEAAKLYLAEVLPEKLAQFVDGFDPVRPPHDFAVQEISDLFDDEMRERIVAISRSVKSGDMITDDFERANFGRLVVWDHPYFLELQDTLTSRVSDLAGRQLEPGYNFLSLYGGEGKCDPHMDEPYSMYTLDYCIEQNCDWPIWFSRTVDWPTLETAREWDSGRLKDDASLAFTPKVLKPNNAVFFSGSSQWHYRDAIPAGGFCSLLFFHYYPAGCEALVVPQKWSAHFGIPELEPLCDLFGEPGRDGLA